LFLILNIIRYLLPSRVFEMYHSKSLALIGLALVTPAVAFVPPTSVASRSHLSLGATRDPSNERPSPPDVIRNLAAASALTLGLLFPSADALAAPLNDHAMQSSTVEVSLEYKTMDFSMPSSYDSIAAPVASGTDELTTTTTVNTAAASKKKAKPKESAVPSGLSKKEAAAAKRAEKVAQREADEAAAAARAEESVKERDENIKAARLQKIAAREAAKAEKDAVDAEKEDAKFKGAKFVDTSMPSY